METKAHSIQHLTDARYFAAQGADWLGFDLNAGSPSALNPKTIKDIRNWVSGPQFIGEFSALQTPAMVADAVEMLFLDAVEIDAMMDLDGIRDSIKVPIVQKWVLENADELLQLETQWAAIADKVAVFLLKLPLSWDSLQQNTAALTALAQLSTRFALWLDIPFAPNQLPEIVEKLDMYGLCVQGGAEERVGYKSFDELDEIFAFLNFEL